MNVKENDTLWINIQNFPLDEPGAAVKFSDKLANAQNWSSAFTQRVITEYRKFIFLCCIAENGASPPKAVDEVWHLHLTYTQSYWINFCRNTLGKDIHHHPSKGGSDEKHKHQDWYRETIQLYTTVFGRVPPIDIWPKAEVKGRIVATALFPAPAKIRRALAVMALPFLLNVILFKKINPFALTGPEFLGFYPLLGLAIMAAYIFIQNEKKVEEIIHDNFPEDATVFQMAKFLYGKHRALQTAIIDLIRRNLLKVNSDKSIFVFNNTYLPGKHEENPLIPALLQQTHCSKTDYETIAQDWYRDDLFAHPALDNLYEFGHREKPFMQQIVFYFVLIAVGIVRIIQGVSNHRPVVFLVVEMLALVFSLYMVMNLSSVKTAVFKKVKALFTEKISREQGHTDSLVNNFVMQGPPAMAGFAEGLLLMALFSSFDPAAGREWRTTTSSDWSSDSGSGSNGCGSSCGSGGCGGCGGGGD